MRHAVVTAILLHGRIASAAPMSSWPTPLDTPPTAELMGVEMIGVDADGHGGWRNFVASADTRRVYVSNTGDDSNDGLSTSTPVATIGHGRTLLRDNHPDWLLLKRGDVFEESLLGWGLKGRSRLEPMVVGSYGSNTSAPILATGSNVGFQSDWEGSPMEWDTESGGGDSGSEPLRDRRAAAGKETSTTCAVPALVGVKPSFVALTGGAASAWHFMRPGRSRALAGDSVMNSHRKLLCEGVM